MSKRNVKNSNVRIPAAIVPYLDKMPGKTAEDRLIELDKSQVTCKDKSQVTCKVTGEAIHCSKDKNIAVTRETWNKIEAKRRPGESQIEWIYRVYTGGQELKRYPSRPSTAPSICNHEQEPKDPSSPVLAAIASCTDPERLEALREYIDKEQPEQGAALHTAIDARFSVLIKAAHEENMLDILTK